jgi:hypothetical protein
MGHQIKAGPHQLNFTAGANLVAAWCNTITPPVKPEGMHDHEWIESWIGNTDISPEAVANAELAVPLTYEDSKAQGFCNGIDEVSFDQCREFLFNAADGGHGITGSW